MLCLKEGAYYLRSYVKNNTMSSRHELSIKEIKVEKCSIDRCGKHIFFFIFKIDKILWNVLMTIFANVKFVSTNVKNAKCFLNGVILKRQKLPKQEPLTLTDPCLNYPVCPRFVSVGSWKSHCFKSYNSLCLVSTSVAMLKGYMMMYMMCRILNARAVRCGGGSINLGSVIL